MPLPSLPLRDNIPATPHTDTTLQNRQKSGTLFSVEILAHSFIALHLWDADLKAYR